VNGHEHAAGQTGIPFIDWFTGGNTPYMTLYHCMSNDVLWIGITIALDVAVATGYMIIARHWWANERTLPDIPAKRALGSLRNIFLLCGTCGYLFIPIKMVWPAWRLYDIFLAMLVYWTWKYALRTKDLKVIYRELGRGQDLMVELEKSREETRKKSFFLNAISHDLRTPLNALMLQTSLAELSLKSDDKTGMQEALKDIRSSAKWTAELLDTLLDFARLDWTDDEQTLTSFKLCEVIDTAVAAVRANADAKRLQLSVQCPPDLMLSTDKGCVARLLANLLVNAVKYTERGSVKVSVETGSGGVEIHVTDTGSGVAPEHQERLFDEFYQVQNEERDRTKGYGLGLAIARRLARKLGGDVVVDSAVGRGSRFTIVLPRSVVTGAVQSNGAHRAEAPVAG
jgi:signal transduction histidine kinase